MTAVPASLDRGNCSPEERRALFEAFLVTVWAMRRAGMLGLTVRLTDAPPDPFGLGAVGPIVGIWQRVVGAKPDQNFGPKTVEATKRWSILAGFGPRAQVEPAMWALAVGLTFGLRDEGVILPDGSAVGCPAVSSEIAQILGEKTT